MLSATVLSLAIPSLADTGTTPINPGHPLSSIWIDTNLNTAGYSIMTFLLKLYNAGSGTLLNASNGTVNVGLFIGDLLGGQAGASIGTNSNHQLRLFTNSTDRVTIDTNGNVGIGNTSPTTGRLVVSGGNIDASSNKVINLAAPTGSADAATKGYVDAATTPSCSVTCPAGWIAVPASASDNTTLFCVMKYEASNTGGTPQSMLGGTPWVSVTQTAAISACASLNNISNNIAGAHLCTEAESQFISNNIAGVASNWQGGAVGSGCLYGGHMNNAPALALPSAVDTNPYAGTGHSASDTFACPFTTGAGNGKEQRRTFTLSNGNVIWDWSGNVWEWLVDTCQSGTGAGYWNNQASWYEWNNAALADYEFPTAGPPLAYNTSAYGVGQYYGCTANGNAFFRGGDWSSGAIAGPFALDPGNAPSYSTTSIGFRCCK